MFYLKNFFKSVLSSKGSGILFCVLTLSLSVGVFYRVGVNETVTKSIQKIGERPHFYSLVSKKENVARIKRRLHELPGVYSVKILKGKFLQNEVQKLLKGLDVDENLSLKAFDYQGLKIVFNKNLKTRSQKLIRNYLTKLVGDRFITLGNIKSSKKKNRLLDPIVSFMKDWSFDILLGLALVGWIGTLFSFQRELNKASYLIEQYQRRTFVALKSYCIGVSILFIASFIILSSLNFLKISGSFLSGISFASLTLVLAPVFFKNYIWKNS